MMCLEDAWFVAAFRSTPMHDPGLREVQRPARVCVCKGASAPPCLLSCCCWRGLVIRAHAKVVHLRAVQRPIDLGDGISNAIEGWVRALGKVFQVVAEAQLVNLKRCILGFDLAEKAVDWIS